MNLIKVTLSDSYAVSESLKIIPAISGTGVFEVEMALFKTKKLEKRRTDLVFDAGEKIYAKVWANVSRSIFYLLKIKSKIDLGIRLDRCWITGDDETDLLILLDSGCPNPELKYSRFNRFISEPSFFSKIFRAYGEVENRKDNRLFRAQLLPFIDFHFNTFRIKLPLMRL